MIWWLERLITSLTKNSSRTPVSGDEQNGEILTEEPSIFSQMYEVNGCYKCSLRTAGLGLGSYRCEVIFMEKQLIVLHLVSRNGLNVSRILAPIAATAFAASFNEGHSKVSRGEWIVLPFDHITMIELQNQGKEANIVTKTGTSYTLGDNEECVSKAFGIFNERRDAESNGELSRGTGAGGARSHWHASLRQADIPINSRPGIGEQSLAEVAPLANTFPGCIVSTSATELAEILTNDLFYGKYVLDPKETFELVVGEWDGRREPRQGPGLLLKQGASRDIQYRRKISTGILDIWVPFTEKHQISFPTDYSHIHISINVKFSIFEKEIGIKILLRIVETGCQETQLDLECELENTQSLPYLIRYQLESSTINSIKLTVDKYIYGIKQHLLESKAATKACPQTGIRDYNHPEYPHCLLKQIPPPHCDQSVICCLHPLTQILRNIFNF
ncbi:hypothetical protein OJ253_799 [Cryptosporidium canis]|uniref:Uncharacterized protein n=1 Tax=Cryptosporidium canis TaxID=195482 RepID=A0A9D5DI37_9CRYT|nr:hypothetical protein OJ253_799 [Cryptosporidium canis]